MAPTKAPRPYKANQGPSEPLGPRITIDGGPLTLESLPWQERVFYEDKHRYKVVAKGRRVGGTTGAAHYIIDRMLSGKIQVLWVDTTRANVRSYWERIFLPILGRIRSQYWSWNETAKVLKLCGSTMDMRSAEKPENLEGQKYHLCVLNEAGIILSDRQLWEVSIRPMLIDYAADCIMVGTPKGRLDKSGKDHLFYDFHTRGKNPLEWKDWASFTIPTADNPLLSRSEIEEMAHEVPLIIRAQELSGEFVNISLDSVIKEEWIRYVDSVPPRTETMRQILSLDTAFKTTESSDFSACTRWLQTYSGRLICTGAWSERLTFPDLVARVKAEFMSAPTDALLIEDKASGQSLIQTLKQSDIPVIPFKSDTDKMSRISSASTTIEGGLVDFLRAPWNREVTGQLILYPQVEHDDLVDTVSQAILYMRGAGVSQSGSMGIVSRRVIRDAKSVNLQTYSIVED